MRVRDRFAAIFAGAILGTLAGNAYADGPTYKIQFDRIAKVGDHWRVERTVVEDMHYVLRNGDRIVRDDKQLQGAKIIADAKVLAVDEGTAKTIAFTIQALFSYDGKADKELLPSGTILVVEAGEPVAKFTVEEKPVPAEMLRAIGMLIRPHTHRNAVSYDNLFGTAVPRQIGDVWSLDPKAVAELVHLSMPAAEISAADAHGNATFVSLEPVDKVPCTTIDIEVHANGLKLKSPTTQPSQTSFNGGDISLHYLEHLPIDPAILGGSGSYSSVKHYTGQFHSGDRVEDFEETMRSESETKTTP